MDQSLAPIDTGLVLDGPSGDPASSGQPEVLISASDQHDVTMDAGGANIHMD